MWFFFSSLYKAVNNLYIENIVIFTVLTFGVKFLNICFGEISNTKMILLTFYTELKDMFITIMYKEGNYYIKLK